MGRLEAASGEQIRIAAGAQEATVVEVGGGLRTYLVAGESVIDGYEAAEVCPSGRGQPLIPWPNRLDGGAYTFDGVAYQLALTEPARGNAIHGLVRFANWTVQEAGTDRVVMAHRLHAHPGYPFALDLTLAYTVGDAGLTVRGTATNIGTARCPFGAGAHPYLRIGDGLIDGLVFTSPARTAYDADDRGIPTGRRPFTEFGTATPIGATRLDTAFTDLDRDGDGRAWAELAESDGPRRLRMWVDGAVTHLMLYTGDSLGEQHRRRHAIAVEPMTCAPDAFRSGDGLLVLEPGTSTEWAWGITPAGFGG